MNVALILSAGSGDRFSKEIPKQFFELKNKPIINYSLELFENEDAIDGFIIVSRGDLVLKTQDISKNFSKCLAVIEGGARRQDSVFNGLVWIDKNIKDCKKVFIHDAARPLVSKTLMSELHKNSDIYSAVVPTIKSDDTLKQIEGDFIVKTIDRAKIVRVQTPQVFSFSLLLDCYKKFPNDSLATDDAFLIEHFGHKVFCVKGERSNIKVTYPYDLKLLEGLI